MTTVVPYLLGVRTLPERIPSNEYPFHLPLVRSLDLTFTSPVTFFVGENGTGKSTVIEAVAALCRLPVSGAAATSWRRTTGPIRPARSQTCCGHRFAAVRETGRRVRIEVITRRERGIRSHGGNGANGGRHANDRPVGRASPQRCFDSLDNQLTGRWCGELR